MRKSTRFRIYVRFVRYLLWEFRRPLGVFWTLVLGGGLILSRTYHHRRLPYVEACYDVFGLIFMEPNLDFPDEWYLQPLFFLLPIVGLGAVAESLVRLGYLIFSRKNQLPEWHRMVASLHRNHVVVVGVGKVGYQIIKAVQALREPVVAIERPGAESALLDEVLDAGVPVIRGDGRTAKTLELAGVSRAKAVLLVTSDDLTNLDAGLTARDLSPAARIVLRLFDESLAVKVAGAFAIPTISTARVSAPAFIAAATGRKVYQEFQLGGRQLHLTDMTVCPTGSLVGRTVGAVQAEKQVNIVMHQGPSGVNVNPAHDVAFAPGDVVLVIAPMDHLIAMEALNQPCHEDGRPANAPGIPDRADGGRRP